MNPWDFRRIVVFSNLKEMITEFGDIRLAMNCILSIDALAAHIYWHGRELNIIHFTDSDDSSYKSRLAQNSEDFRILRDVANGIKHCNLIRGTPVVTGSTSLASRGIGGVGSGSWDDNAVWNDEARWNDGPGELPQVVVQLSDGNVRTLEAIAKTVIELVDRELAHIPEPE